MSTHKSPSLSDLQKKYVGFTLDEQQFGLDVILVEDIVKVQRITPIPLAIPQVIGTLNLRGRIVTVIDVRVHLGVTLSPERANVLNSMIFVVTYKGNLYGLVVDEVGDVVNLVASKFERNFGTLDPRWRTMCSGIYRMEDHLLLILDPTLLMQSVERLCGVVDEQEGEGGSR